MSATVVQNGVSVPPGDKFVVSKTITLDNSYPNPAGYVFTPASLGLNMIRKIINIEATTLPAAATWVYWVAITYAPDGTIASFALHLAVVSTGVEVANAVNVSTAAYNLVVEGV